MKVNDLIGLLVAAPPEAEVYLVVDGSYFKAATVDTNLPTGRHTNQSLFIYPGSHAGREHKPIACLACTERYGDVNDPSKHVVHDAPACAPRRA